ncbi:MAG: DUF3443 family protein [Terriglobales bacterium]
MPRCLSLIVVLGLGVLAGCGGSSTPTPPPAPRAGLAPSSLDFGNVALGSNSVLPVTLQNAGNEALQISGISIAGAQAGNFLETNTCGSSLAAGGSCTINVTFAPIQAGVQNATLQVSDNASGSPQTVSLQGTGTGAVVSFNPSTLSFGTVTVGQSSQPQTTTLTNLGTTSLQITSVGIGGSDAGDFSQTNTCSTTVAAGKSCSIIVTFTPTATGSRNAVVSVSDNGAGSPHTAPLSGTGGSPGNVQAITVDGGPVPNQIYANAAFTSVTICNPGTTTCQTIDGILVDTGSFGLRILASAITLSGLQPLTSGSSNLYNCINFIDSSYLWGAAEVADVQIANEKASSETIQVIADPTNFTIPTNCSNGGIDEDNLNGLGANGILGIGTEPVDCGEACDPNFDNGLPAEPFYYACSSGNSCTPASVLISQQVANPVALFPVDNNGTIIELPALSGAAATETGSLVFGIGTQTNNQVPNSATIFTLDQYDTFSVTFNGTTYNSGLGTPSFIDLGSNAFFFPDANIPTCADATYLYCPTSLLNLSAVNTGENNATCTVDFSIDNADNLFNSGGGADAAFSTLGGPDPGAGFDYGLPFFYGRNVFTSIDGQTVPSGAPPAPWWAY